MLDILDQFRAELEGQDKSRHTVSGYLRDVRLFLTGREPATITNPVIRAWRDELEQSAKPSTVNRKVAALRAFYDWYSDKAGIPDPTEGIKAIKDARVMRKALTADQVAKLIAEVEKSQRWRDIALVRLMLATGARSAEVSALRLSDYDADAGTVTIRGKGRKWRTIPLNGGAKRALDVYLDFRRPHEDGPLFPSQVGDGHLSGFAVWYTIKKYAKRAGLVHVSPHSLRHTVATRLVRDPETDMVTAASVLGHSQLDTTARYSQPDEDDLRRAVDRIDS